MKKILIVCVMLAAAVCSVFAANRYYEKGDSVFSARLGVVFPAFLGFTANDTHGFETWFSGTHLKLGGVGNLSYQYFVSSVAAVGGEVGYHFSNSRAGKLLITIPITARLSLYPVQTGKFDFKVNFNAGASLIKYNEQRYFAPYASVSVSPTFYVSDSWGIGLDAGLWANFEFYTSKASGVKDSQDCFGGFLPLTLTVTYRH